MIGEALARDARDTEAERGGARGQQRRDGVAAGLVGRMRGLLVELANGFQHRVRAAVGSRRERFHDRIAHGAGLTVTSIAGFSTAPGPNGNGMEVFSIRARDMVAVELLVRCD